MAAQQRNDSERFTEMEYMLNKYYNEHCAKIVSSEIKTFNERQKIEYQKEYDEYLRNFGYNAVQGFHPRGDWARKGAEDLMNDIDARLKDDTVLQADLKAMAERWKQWAIARMGKEKYDQILAQENGKELIKAEIIRLSADPAVPFSFTAIRYDQIKKKFSNV